MAKTYSERRGSERHTRRCKGTGCQSEQLDRVKEGAYHTHALPRTWEAEAATDQRAAGERKTQPTRVRVGLLSGTCKEVMHTSREQRLRTETTGREVCCEEQSDHDVIKRRASMASSSPLQYEKSGHGRATHCTPLVSSILEEKTKNEEKKWTMRPAPPEVRLLSPLYLLLRAPKKRTCGAFASIQVYLPHPLRLEVAQVRDGGVDPVHYKHPRLFLHKTEENKKRTGCAERGKRGEDVVLVSGMMSALSYYQANSFLEGHTIARYTLCRTRARASCLRVHKL